MIKKIIFILMLLGNVAYAMEPIADEQMADVNASTGVNIFFDGATRIEAKFASLSVGDPDGDGTNNNPGYFVVEGLSSQSKPETNTIGLEISNCMLSLDVGTTGGTGIAVAGLANAVPANTTFLKVSLSSQPNLKFTITPAYKNLVEFQNTNGKTTPSVVNRLGALYMTNITVDIKTIYNDMYVSAH